jgi:hypothetical protein
MVTGLCTYFEDQWLKLGVAMSSLMMCLRAFWLLRLSSLCETPFHNMSLFCKLKQFVKMAYIVEQRKYLGLSLSVWS